jgi:hypothetical protein
MWVQSRFVGPDGLFNAPFQDKLCPARYRALSVQPGAKQSLLNLASVR